MGQWADLTRALEGMLHLRTYPVAFKRLESEAEFDQIPRVRRIGHRHTLCQAIGLARTAGWTVGATNTDMGNHCAAIAGIATRPESFDFAERTGVWFKNKEDAAKAARSIPQVPQGNYNALVLAPLAGEKFDPELVLIFGNPAQMMLLINGLQWVDYERMHFHFVGESACADSISEALITGKPHLSIPCYGERRMGGVTDDELLMAIPAASLPRAVSQLEELAAVGRFRYPIPPLGTEVDPSFSTQRSYGQRG